MKKRLLTSIIAICMLVSLLPTMALAAETEPWGGGDGSAGYKAYEISTVEQLKELAKHVNEGQDYSGKYFKLTANIDLAGEDWTPIGTKEHSFKGHFDGNNKTISNLTINNADLDYAGLFGKLETSGELKNVTINNVSITAGAQVGALAGSAYTGTVSGVTVKGNIQIKGSYKVGGLAGEGYAKIDKCVVDGADGSTITGSYKATNLEGDCVGGLVGFRGEGTTIVTTSCTVNNVMVTGTRKVGGLIGSTFYNNTVTDCSVENVTVGTNATAEYANDNQKTMCVGGLLGIFNDNGGKGTLSNCWVENITLTAPADVTARMGYISGGSRGEVNATSGEFPVPTAEQLTVDGVAALGTNSGSNIPSTQTDTIVLGGTPYTDQAARIGGKLFDTLQAAIDSVNTKYGTTIILCKSIEETVTTSGKPANGKYEVRLNFGGHTMTGDINNGSWSIYLNEKSNGTLVGNLNNRGTNSPYLRVYNTVVKGNITCGADVNTYSKDKVYIYDGSHVTGTLTKGGKGSITAYIGSCYKESPENFLELNGTLVKRLATTDDHGCNYQVAADEVAKIIRNGESTTYPTLSKTFQAIQDGDTVEILKDISENTSFQIGKSITIDLKGHSITSNVSTSFKINKDAEPRINVVIKNGTLNNHKTGDGLYCVVWALRHTDLTLENVKLEASGENAMGMQIGSADTGNNPTVTINGAESAVTGKLVGIGIFNNNNGNAAGPTSGTLVVEDGIITGGGYGIAGNGTNHNTSITINGGTVKSTKAEGTGIFHPQQGNLTVNSGTIEGDTGIEMRAGTLNVNGGTIAGTAANFTKAENGSGNTTHGVGIAVSQHTTNLPITVNIKKTGENPPVISGQYALYEEDLQDTTAIDQIKITIIDGEFTSTATGESAKAVYSENVKSFISGGYFTNDPSEYVVEGKAAVASDKAGYSHMVGEKSAEGGIIVKPATKAPSVYSDIKDETAKSAANTSANTVSAPAIVDAANKEARDLTQEEKQKVAETLKTDPGTEVIIYAQTYLDIQTTKYDRAADAPSLSMDITPKMQLIASTAKTADRIVLNSAGKNSVTYGEPQDLTIITPTQISLTLPSTFAKKTVYIKHEASNGKTYYYTAQADDNANITFTSQHGFSPFTFLTKNEAAAEVNGIGYPTLQDAVNAVQDGQTIKVLKDGDTATVNRKVKFAVATDTGVANYTIAVTGNYKNQSTTANEYDVVPAGSSGGSGGSVTTYAITTNSPVNGTVTASPKSAAKGATVTLAVAPTEGYQLDKLTVADNDGKEITLTDEGNGKYTFTMPASKVEVTATFKQAPVVHVCPSEKYTDVDTTQWYHEGVDYVIANGMMNGTGTNIFEPNATTTRGMIVTILYRLEKEPAAGTSPFTDVDATQWYAKAVAWAAANGVVNGTSPTTFNPNDPITREQMAAILYRYASFKGYDVTQKADLAGFTDAAQISDYAKDPMAWANKAGLIGGVSATTLQPQGSATRAQVATILMRFCENVAK